MLAWAGAMPDWLLGVVLSIGTAVFWAISPICWASAGRRIGSFPVLLLRSLVAAALLLVVLPLYLAVTPGHVILPSAAQVLWLVVSGALGMALGDALLYEGFVQLGPRRGSQVLTLAPASSVILAWFWLDEQLSARTMAGILLVLGATLYAVMARRRRQATDREPGRVTLAGVLVAVAGAVLVGLGAVAGRRAFAIAPAPDVFAATTLRVVSSAALLWLAPVALGTTRATIRHLGDRFIISRMIPGVMCGPVLGMLCYVGALKYLQAGPVSTLSAMSPVFLLPIMTWRYGARFGLDIIAATLLAAGGVAMISWR